MISTLKNIKINWSDNTGSVGYTSIWGRWTPDEMRALLEVCPRGTFMQTSLYEYRDVKTPEQAEELIKWRNKNFTYYRAIDRLGFYFNFPLDRFGCKLLELLGEDPTKAKFYDRREYALCRK